MKSSEEIEIQNRINELKEIIEELNELKIIIENRLLIEKKILTNYDYYKIKIELREINKKISIQSTFYKDWCNYFSNIFLPDFTKKSQECNDNFDKIFSEAKILLEKIKIKAKGNEINKLQLLISLYKKEEMEDQSNKNKYYESLKKAMEEGKKYYKI